MSNDRKLRMWIYFTLLVVALLIIVITVHFSRTAEVNPEPSTGTVTVGSQSQSCDDCWQTVDITFYMMTLNRDDDLTLATVTISTYLTDTSTENILKVAFQYLASPPVKIDGMFPILPTGTKVKSVSIKDGIVHVDFSREILFPEYPSATSESLALCAIAGIPSQLGMDSVFITVEGKPSGPIAGPMVSKRVEDFWGHIGLYDQPLHPCSK